MVSVSLSPLSSAAIVGCVVSRLYSHAPVVWIENDPYAVAVDCATSTSSPGSGSMTVTVPINVPVSSLSIEAARLEKKAGEFPPPALTS